MIAWARGRPRFPQSPRYHHEMGFSRSTQEGARMLRFPELRELEVLEARFVSYSFGLHTHDTLAMGVIDEGAATLWCRGSTFVAPCGGALVVAPGEVHTGGRHRDAAVARYRMIYPGADWLAIATGDARL